MVAVYVVVSEKWAKRHKEARWKKRLRYRDFIKVGGRFHNGLYASSLFQQAFRQITFFSGHCELCSRETVAAHRIARCRPYLPHRGLLVAGTAPVLRHASTSALGIASANASCVASARSSSSAGRFGCLERERRSFQAGSAISIRASAASVDAPASINRSRLQR